MNKMTTSNEIVMNGIIKYYIIIRAGFFLHIKKKSKISRS